MANADRIIELLHEAKARPAGAERDHFLVQACGDDAALKEQIVSLLKADANEGGADFLKKTLILRPPASVIEKPGDRIGRYKLLEQIGEGGCGVVYMAEQEEPVRRRVALKVIKLGMDTKQVIARFEAERQALALMDHPNIAKVLDGGATQTGRPCFVMELVRGIKITDYCDQNNLPTEERLKLFTQVCQAIQHAHQKGIIHRDIKPSNILVTISDPGSPGCPKVIDFGIAKATTGQRLTDMTIFTAFEQFIGTPAYMSPEQAMLTSLDIDTRTDIYALGVLLYELLTGRTPFDAKELMAGGLDAMRRIILEQEPARPSTRLSTLLAAELSTVASRRHSEPARLGTLLRGDLDWIVMKALEKDRTRRYETASGLAADVERHMSNQPVVARPPSNHYRIQKMIRRNKLAFAAATAVTAALVLGLGVSTWMFFKEKHARQRAGFAEKSERQLRQQAETISDENRRLADANQSRLIRLHTANGLRLGEEENWGASLPFLSEALKLSEKASTDTRMARFRLHAVLDRWPRLVQLMQHTGVRHVEFGPDSLRLLVSATQVSGIETDDARIWDVTTGKPVTASVPAMFASFGPDGRRFVATISGQSLNASVRDAASGKPLLPSIALSPHGDAKAWFAPDGTRILTIDSHYGSGPGRFGEARVWDAATAQPISLPMPHADVIYHAVWSPDGQQVATVSEDETVQIWDAKTGKPLIPPLRNEGRIWHATFSPDNKYIALDGSRSGSRLGSPVSGGVRIFNLQTGEPATPLMKHAAAASFVDFSPDGRRLVSASYDGTARVWDSSTGEWVTPPLKHGSWVVVARFSPDGSMVVSASYDGTARLWDAQTGASLAVLNHMDKVLDAAFSPDGRFLATACGDHLVRIWDLSSTDRLSTELFHEGMVFPPASFSPDGSRVAAAGVAAAGVHSVNVWDVRSGDRLLKIEQPGQNRQDTFVSALFSPNGRQLLTCRGVYDARTGERTAGFPTDNIRSAQFSATGEKIVVTTISGSAPLVLEAATGKLIAQSPGTNRESLRHVAFSPDERLVAEAVATAGFRDGYVRVWDVASGALERSLPHEKGVRFVAFSPDSSKVATACFDKSIRVWNVGDGQAAQPPMYHEDETTCVTFSPDGRLIASASWDKTARIWDVASRRPMTPPLRHRQQVETAAFSPDGKFLLSVAGVRMSDPDGEARLWDVSTGELACPPFKHWQITSAIFAPNGRQILTTGRDGRVCVWTLPSDDLQTEDALLWAEVLSGHKIDATGSLTPLATDAFYADFQRLRSRFPQASVFTPEIPAKWHDKEALASAHREDWFAARFHLDRLLAANPGNISLKERRAHAQGELEKLKP